MTPSTPERDLMPVFEFDRYHDGVLMAGGVKVSLQPDLASAMRVAVRLADRGDVLILRATSAHAALAEKNAEIERLRAENAAMRKALIAYGMAENDMALFGTGMVKVIHVDANDIGASSPRKE